MLNSKPILIPFVNKKFELMLKRCAKAYSSYWTTTVKYRLLRGTAFWCPRVQIPWI